ncbi:hypothetical protein AOCH_007471 [Aspergillus ochraceoroseus]|uniref:Uncharacterized protein n=1 Tax=Aspergillus ochraceoroseus TaxID=138278 RepID=A0A0F8WWT3_9EURO|nr:hypothetical protein AOCH_007471 [Aspergillus ochraceoroseus]
MEIYPAPHEPMHPYYHHHQMNAITTSSTPTITPPPRSPYRPTVPQRSLPVNVCCRRRHRFRRDPQASSPSITTTLRRMSAASNLNRTTTQMGSTYHAYPFSASSTASSPLPPLSPSYSPSTLSEQLPEILDGLSFPGSSLVDVSHYDSVMDEKQSSYKLLDTFRARLEKFPDPDPPDLISILGPGHNRARSDSVLFKARRARKAAAPTTVIHQGTSFEILNPRESLNVARIVSYIEDVDAYSNSNHRDSYPNASTTFPAGHHDSYWGTLPPFEPEANQKVHDDLVGDSPHHPMPSISERLEEPDAESCYSPSVRPLSRTLSMIRPWTAHNDSDLGEPGPPVSFDDSSNTPLTSPDRDGYGEGYGEEYGIGIGTGNRDIGIDIAALYDIGYLPEQGKGTDNPTTIIYSQHKPLRKKSTVGRKKRKGFSSPSTSGFLPSRSARTNIPNPLKRLRGIAHALRKKTFPRANLS